MARRKKSSEGEGAPPWLTTYADLMSLLLTFFVLLLSFSSISDPDKFEEALTSIRGALSVFKGSDQIVPISRMMAQQERSAAVQRIARELRQRLQVLGKEQDVDMKFDEGGLRLNLPSHVLFDSASAQLKPDAEPILSEVGAVLASVQGIFIEVRGHTDDRPLLNTSVYRDNYDLSYGRAKSVASFLNQSSQFPMEALEMVPKGPSQPIATNDTPEGRQSNRRVELFIRAQDVAADLTGLEEQLRELTEQPATP